MSQRLVLLALVLILVACQAQPPTPPPTPTPPAGVFIDASRSLGQASRLALGTNHGPWAGVSPDVLPLFDQSGLTVIRWPGGNWGDENDMTPQQVDDFIALARRIKAEPLISVRLRGGSAELAAAIVDYTLRKDYQVRYWSIGNEPSLYAPTDAQWDTEFYNSEWRRFAQAMKAKDPTIKLVGPDTHQFTGEAQVDPKDAKGRDWLREFLKANGDLVDIVAVHRYPFPVQQGAGAATLDQLMADPPRWDSLAPNLRAVVKASAGRDIPIAVTEFNSHWTGATGGEAGLDTFNNALWLGDVLARLLTGRVDLVTQFSLSSSGSVGGFGLLSRFEARPSYYVYQMVKDFGLDLVAARSDAPRLYAYASLKGDALTVLVNNLSASPVTRPLTVSGFQPTGPARVTLFDKDHPAQAQADPAALKAVTFPAYSMTLLTLPGKATTMLAPTITDPTTATQAIPAAAWSRPLGQPYPQAGKSRVEYKIVDDGPWGGVPLGGLGAGSIGRTPRGDFARWHLDLGKHTFQPLPANQFSVFVQQGDQKQAHVLSTLRPDSLKDWNWDWPVGAGTYYGLFPKAWYVYDWDKVPVKLVQKQFSPVIPDNYRESSYPVGLFEWSLQNPTDKPLTVSVMFSWQNMVGREWGRDLQGGNLNQAFKQDGLTGLVMTRDGDRVQDEWDGQFALVTPDQPGVTVTYQSRFTLNEAGGVWTDFAAWGRLRNVDDRTPAGRGEVLVGALAVQVDLAPGETRAIPFALAWDFPITEFGDGTQWYKRYTKFYGTTGRTAWAIAADGIRQRDSWEAQIDTWQRPILQDTARPDWYKTALFNELYYLVDGGTVWENGRVDGGAGPATRGTPREVGHFAFMECFDYPFYNTFDVNFYASYALALLWPELEQSIIRDFAATVPQSDPTLRTVEWSKKPAPRKTTGALPHDVGMPGEDPFLKPNAYNFQDINVWKDLNSKFALQVWRDYVITRDETLVRDTWRDVVQALDYLHTFDRDGDGLPDHEGLPDQTYDTWPMNGVSAYASSLWLASLEAAVEMGKLVGDSDASTRYAAWLAKGKPSFETKLWNGRYYLYDSSGGPHSDSIMADQLAGQWYADATGLPPIVPAEHVASALKTIFDFNVKRFGDGDMGAVNGMRPDGTIDTSSEQSQEAWGGTVYGLAAFMLHRGLRDQAWATAHGVYNVTYNRGYWFRTPEAYDVHNNFRASLYMRPLSIWAMEHALDCRLCYNR
ncbi:MAG: hypothetical protein KIT87_04165 [Anaerolineae bacterium]|nr:hypothetical protein [Anaerolineae bacterium]